MTDQVCYFFRCLITYKNVTSLLNSLVRDCSLYNVAFWFINFWIITNDITDLHRPSHGTLLLQGPCPVFYAGRRKKGAVKRIIYNLLTFSSYMLSFSSNPPISWLQIPEWLLNTPPTYIQSFCLPLVVLRQYIYE